jgi:hypothetical protein
LLNGGRHPAVPHYPPGSYLSTRHPAKNHSFAVYAPVRLCTTIRSSFSRAPLIPPPRIGGPAFLLPIAPVLWRLGRADICAELCTDGAPGAWEDAAKGTRPASCFHLFRLEAGLCPYIAGPAPSASAIARALLPKPLFTGEPSDPMPYAPPCCACTIGHNAHRA